MTPTVTSTPTSTPTATATATPCPDCKNDTLDTAFGPLTLGQPYNGYPEDENDFYYFETNDTYSIEVVLENYDVDSNGQLLIYERYFDPEEEKQSWRRIGQDGGDSSTRRVPNSGEPNALKDLPPERYMVRIYTVGKYNAQPYELKVYR